MENEMNMMLLASYFTGYLNGLAMDESIPTNVRVNIYKTLIEQHTKHPIQVSPEWVKDYEIQLEVLQQRKIVF